MNDFSKHYQPTDPTLWQGRSDAKPNEYLYQIIQPLDLTQLKTPLAGFALLGFCCDAGVKRNQGRPGAKQGPIQLRKALAKLPIHQSVKIYDAGNIICDDDNLEAAQQSLAAAVTYLLTHGLKPIVLGGGHETAWGHYQGIADYLKTKKLAIVNLDAHFDLRELLPGDKGSSGTPFRQIALARQQQGLSFDYYCIGIQPTANTPSLFTAAKQFNTHYLLASECEQTKGQAIIDLLTQVTEEYDHIYLTICLDVFAAAFAPGVSAPHPLGLYPQQVLPSLKQLATSNKLVSFDIVELAPCFDQQDITAKLAASLLSELLVSAI